MSCQFHNFSNLEVFGSSDFTLFSQNDLKNWLWPGKEEDDFEEYWDSCRGQEQNFCISNMWPTSFVFDFSCSNSCCCSVSDWFGDFWKITLSTIELLRFSGLLTSAEVMNNDRYSTLEGCEQAYVLINVQWVETIWRKILIVKSVQITYTLWLINF